MYYRIGFPIERPWVLSDGRVLGTPVWDSSEHTWQSYDDITSVITVLGLHPHPDMCVVYEYPGDGTRTLLRTV